MYCFNPTCLTKYQFYQVTARPSRFLYFKGKKKKIDITMKLCHNHECRLRLREIKSRILYVRKENCMSAVIECFTHNYKVYIQRFHHTLMHELISLSFAFISCCCCWLACLLAVVVCKTTTISIFLIEFLSTLYMENNTNHCSLTNHQASIIQHQMCELCVYYKISI